MIAENLKNTFDQYYPLPDSFWESVEEAGEFIEVNAETITCKAVFLCRERSVVYKPC